ncbi:MAG: YbaK/EbsC family protein [Nitrososphaerota archaeon]
MSTVLTTRDLKKFMEARGVEGEMIYLEAEQAKTSASAASAVGCPLSQIAKNIVLNYSSEYCVVVIPGDRKVDLEKFSQVVGSKVGLAKPDEVLRITDYPVGAVPPFGHLNKLKVYVDKSLLRHDTVYTSGGAVNVLLKIRTDLLLKAVDGEVVEFCNPE